MSFCSLLDNLKWNIRISREEKKKQICCWTGKRNKDENYAKVVDFSYNLFISFSFLFFSSIVLSSHIVVCEVCIVNQFILCWIDEWVVLFFSFKKFFWFKKKGMEENDCKGRESEWVIQCVGEMERNRSWCVNWFWRNIHIGDVAQLSIVHSLYSLFSSDTWNV